MTEENILRSKEFIPQRTQIMTVPEIAKYLGIHNMTVYRLIKDKKIPAFKLGGMWRTKKDFLDKYLEERMLS